MTPTTTVVFDLAELEVRPGTFDAEMAREIFVDRYYTCDGWEMAPGATVLDIGGGIGAFAVYAAAGGASVVHTFEPVADNWALLVRNCAPYPTITAHRAAVATHTGTVRMSPATPMPDGTLNTGRPAIAETGVEVAAVDVHDVLALAPRWDVVKVDIEGYEYELLAALTPDEWAKVGTLTMEFHHDDERGARARGLDLAATIGAAGFPTVEVSYSWGEQGRLRARR